MATRRPQVPIKEKGVQVQPRNKRWADSAEGEAIVLAIAMMIVYPFWLPCHWVKKLWNSL